jgi:endo-1,3(4)-beta-glucanase
MRTQYGYVLYGAAVEAKFNTTFVTEYDSVVRDIIRDIANPIRDSYFPSFRQFDWYAGHSWSSGLFFTTRNQESSSEAINAWYSTWLYGLATSATEIEAAGGALLAAELIGVQTYYHVYTNNSVYSSPFSDNKVVGILWGASASYTTFFGEHGRRQYARLSRK